ncbi:hypothetical protein [Flavobacterium sp. ABG]|nr:hypothetical protein [Flavobacterium sp. ABG]
MTGFCKNAEPTVEVLGFTKLLALLEEYVSWSQLNSFIEGCEKAIA